MIEPLLVLLLILLNGAFALAETALISSRRIRLEHLEEAGRRQARTALELLEKPEDFLATVQIGITLIGILAGAFGGAALAGPLAELLARVGWLAPVSDSLALALVVVAITYLSLVLGELVPKRIALVQPERLALQVAGPLRGLSVVAGPAVRLLTASTRLVLRLLGVPERREQTVSEAEIRKVIELGTRAGVIEEAEEDIVENVFRFGDRLVSTLMTPRREIAWVDLDDDWATLRNRLEEHPHSYLVVVQGGLDGVLGVVSCRDLLARKLAGAVPDLGSILFRPVFLPETMRALDALEQFKAHAGRLALVVDEYGSVAGLITPTDLLEALVGDIPTPEELARPRAIARPDGSWLIDGLLSMDDLREQLDLESLPEGALDDYATVGGFVIRHLGRIPAPGEAFDWEGLRFEVLDMDGGRVDKVLVARQEAAGENREPGSGPETTGE